VGVARRSRTEPFRPLLLRPGWPLALGFVGFPVFWLLGAAGFVWPVLAVPMLFSLIHRRTIRLPPGFLLWAGFVCWMLFSGVELDSFGRTVGFAYRGLVYLAATIVLLYVFNSDPDTLRTRRILTIMCVFWIYVVIGGFLGLLFPYTSFTSPVEHLIPRDILSNDFVKELVHPAFAQVQTFLGYATPRPSAPFVYTNDWGAAFGLLVPLVVLAWRYVSPRLRAILVPVGAASIVPVVYSLNRGLWVSLTLGLIYAGVRLTIRGHQRATLAFVAGCVLLAGAVFFTPLRSTIDVRLATPHSNERRVSLYEEAIQGASQSPLFGFGGPRPSKWNPNAPSVGTQGQIWLVLFSHGIPATALFLGWFGYALLRLRRTEPPAAFWAHVVLVVMFLQLPVYALLPTQIQIVMLAVGLAWRELRPRAPEDIDPLARPVVVRRRHRELVA
jgi:hypothetical protein